MASTGAWFESVAEAQRRAKKRLPKSVYYALVAGTEQGITLRDNVIAFSELGFRPHVADLPEKREQATTILGQDITLPVIISPTGVQAVHPDGEVAVARAAAAAGTVMGLSSFASKPIEEVVAANPATFFQTYWVGGRDRVLQRAERAKKAGAKALMVTLDWTFATRRDWGSPPIPERLDLQTMIKFAPEVLVRPRYLLDWLRHRTLPDLTVPNLAPPGEKPPAFFGAYRAWLSTPPPTWEDIRWLREQWHGPFVIKGITLPDDARRAVDTGASAISVSNHGGNNLDTTPGAIRALPGVVDAVGDKIEILFDGGVRRGGDVAKALALGARAVMIGRAYLWGMGANGEAGVKNVLDILRSGIDEALLGLGRSSIHDLVPEDLIIPADFTQGPRI
jgi:heme/flavin dehydrogenase (mycofactocin system)